MKPLVTAITACLVLVTAAPAAAQRPMVVDDLFRIRTVSGVAISPDGTSVAYELSRMRDVTAGEKNGSAVSAVRVATGANADRLLLGEDVDASAVSFVDDDTVAYLADHKKRRAVWTVTLGEGSAPSLLFAHSRSISRYALSGDGETLFFTARDVRTKADAALRRRGFDANVVDEDVRYTRVYRVDLTAPKPKAVRLGVEGHVSTLAASPDGSLLAIGLADTPLVADDIINKSIEIVDGRTGETLRRVETEGKVGEFAFDPSGEHLAFLAGTGRHDASAHTVGVLDVIEGTTTFLTGDDDADEVDVLWLDEERMRVLAHHGTASATYTLTIDGERSDREEQDGFVLTDIVGDEDGIAAIGTAPSHPPALYHAGRAGTFAKWTDHNGNWLADVTLYPQRVVRYEADDGIEVEGVLIEAGNRADGDGNGAPTIVVVHGGPESHYVNGWLTGYSVPGQIGAGQGFAVFYPNYRGSTGRGQAFAALDHDDPPAAEFDDILDGIDHLAAEGVTDPERVGITGGSYGGYASAWGATKLTDRFRAAVVFVALTDLRSFIGTTDISEEMVDSHFRQTPEDAPQIYTDQSPVSHAAQSTTPTLILHGEADPRVHPSQSLYLYRTMQRLSDAPVRLVTYPREGHGNRSAAAQFDYAHRMLRWFDTYLNGERTDEKPSVAVEAVQALEPSESVD